VLVKVHAFGVNRADTMQRQGRYPPPAGVTDIIGLEAAGEIVQVGDQAREKWNIGDRVGLARVSLSVAMRSLRSWPWSLAVAMRSM
jgi:NADPH:quinone reductase-like Zn-dependent oxidoreductase